MHGRAALIAHYAQALSGRCGVVPDLALLDKVVQACGPAIYAPAFAELAPGDAAALAQIKTGFLIRKLGLPDGPRLDEAIEAAWATCARGEGPVYRAVLCYLLVRHFGREATLG